MSEKSNTDTMTVKELRTMLENMLRPLKENGELDPDALVVTLGRLQEYGLGLPMADAMKQIRAFIYALAEREGLPPDFIAEVILRDFRNRAVEMDANKKRSNVKITKAKDKKAGESKAAL